MTIGYCFFAISCSPIVVCSIFLSWKTEIWYFDYHVVAHQAVSARQVPAIGNISWMSSPNSQGHKTFSSVGNTRNLIFWLSCCCPPGSFRKPPVGAHELPQQSGTPELYISWEHKKSDILTIMLLPTRQFQETSVRELSQQSRTQYILITRTVRLFPSRPSKKK